MSFFDQELARVPLSEPEPEPIEARPPWDGPPHGVLPGLVPARVILARDDRMLVMVHDLRAYPTGLLLTLALWHRQRRDRDLQRDVLEDFVFAEHPRLGGRRRRGALRFGLEFADGRRWSSRRRPGRGDLARIGGVRTATRRRTLSTKAASAGISRQGSGPGRVRRGCGRPPGGAR